MSANFYARYDPGKPSTKPTEGGAINGQKRKHEGDSDSKGKKLKTDSTNESSKRKTELKPKRDNDVLAKYSITKHAKTNGVNENEITRRKGDNVRHSKEGKDASIRDNYSATRDDRPPGGDDLASKQDLRTGKTTNSSKSLTNPTSLKENDTIRYKETGGKSAQSAEHESHQEIETSSADSTPDEDKNESAESTAEEEDESARGTADENEDEDVQDDNEITNVNSKYSSILSKFKRSSKLARTNSTKQATDEHEPIELHGLEPIPQPIPTSTSPSVPTYSTLPSWLANPTRTLPSDRKPFSKLNLDNKLLANLQAKNMIEAFSIQSAVIPLLINGNNDICISAPTGSGKTLAYVLPMIQALQDYTTTQLRGLIVVPTRELVKQAREVCEMCATGASLKIATAVGSKSLKEEEELLVEQFQEYNPDPDDSIDWKEFDFQDVLQKKPGFIRRMRSKIDILICTPGRLVEHLRSTRGFSLDHLEWLVIDEADRLMNESFQEWIEVVIPALENRNPKDQELTESILKQMRRPMPIQPLQKVILSATFSLDISKLNSLKLRNPKLVVVGEQETLLTLPPLLEEYAVPVGDSDKPLHLLELMKARLQSNPSMKCLIFAGSTESAQRLHRLLSILDPSLKLSTLTKTSKSSSQRVLSLLQHGKISFIIATDRASRGLDISELDHVISYDIPTSLTSYVHRVGRTARAGLEGKAWTLITHREARWFWNEIGKSISRQGKVHKVNVEPKEEMKERYEGALKALGDEVLDR